MAHQGYFLLGNVVLLQCLNPALIQFMNLSNTLIYIKKAILRLQNVSTKFQIHNLNDDFQLDDMQDNAKIPPIKKWFLL